ncbi:glycosyltransferase 87 family protein [Nocardioides sp. InS609-2]|uniref:glycosyltransferase family 87 protein n=1 Tax=Nocardioides sp. InS609-2 TaxID=2760705 RepID=UPI0020C14870|nr:glycosyltransferase 87 family protein [Nocardioides sp. InS609-2]
MTGRSTGDEFESRVHPTQDDSVVAAVSESVGGPMGRHAAPHRFWSPVRVLLLLTALCFAVGLVQKAPCANSLWQDGAENYNNMCYSDLPPLYYGRGLADGHWPYTDDPVVRAQFDVMEYPVGISYWAWATAKVTRAIAPDDGTRDVAKEARLYTAVNAVGFALLALLATWFLAGVTRRRPWDAAGFAIAPTLALTALINWDLLAVTLVAAALWTWSRDRPVLTGVLIGLGTATKLYPLFLLGGILVICLRRLRRVDGNGDTEESDPVFDFGAVAGSAAVAWLLANAPAYISGPAEWKVFWTFNSGRGADLGSIWLVLQQVFDHPMQPELINKVSWLFFGAWCVGVLLIGLKAPATPRLAQLGFLVVAGFLLINKVYSPQYVLWLLPLAALARPRWRDLLIWQTGEIVYFAAVWLYLGDYLAPAGGGDAGFYSIATLLRIATELYLVAIVARDVLRQPLAENDAPASVSKPVPPVSRS